MINQAILIGNLGANPECRQTGNETVVKVVNFPMATSRHWKNTDGKPQEETEWHRIVAFGRLAEVCEQYLSKGSKVYIEGRLHTHNGRMMLEIRGIPPKLLPVL